MHIIAHRGASAAAPESTACAIRKAVAAGASMIELDVQTSGDGRLVVFHDVRLERTTNGRGRLSRQPFGRLARLDAGSWFGPQFAGERILLVSQAAALIPKKVRINLELKKTAHPRLLISRLLSLIRRSHLQSRVILSSFDAALISLVKPAAVARALICRRAPMQALRQAVRLGCRYWHPHVSLASPASIKAAHAAGLSVNVWTVDDVRTARKLKAWGADGIFTNDPRRLRKAVQ